MRPTYQVVVQRKGFCPEYLGSPGVPIQEAQALAEKASVDVTIGIPSGTACVGIYDNTTHRITYTHGHPNFYR